MKFAAAEGAEGAMWFELAPSGRGLEFLFVVECIFGDKIRKWAVERS